MDQKTGQIVSIPAGMSLADYARSEGRNPNDFKALRCLPDGTCAICKGKGYKKRGLFSRRFKPCDCTQVKR